MRAAIAAFDAGADVAMISKLHPTRSHSGAAEGGINAALGNASEDDPESHAYDRKARELARMFRDNFEKYADDASAETAAAGPRV